MSRILGSAAVRDQTFEEALDVKKICVLSKCLLYDRRLSLFVYVADDELMVSGKPI